MRKVARRLLFSAIMVVAIGLAAPATAWAKSYTMGPVDIQAAVAPDGSMLVSETRTFDFSGDFTFVYWDLDTSGGTAVDVLGVQGPDGPYSVTTDPNADVNRPAGTYQVIDKGGTVQVKVFFRMSNTDVPFTLSYVVRDAAKRYQDTSELYWQFIGDRADVPVSDVSIDIQLPNPGEAVTAGENVRAWAHGPLTGYVGVDTASSVVTLTVPDVPAYTFVEARVAFPASWLAQAETVQSARLSTILSEEEKWASEANRERAGARFKLWGSLAVAFVFPLAMLAFAVNQFMKHGKEYKPQFQGDYFRELPAELPPALVGALMRMGQPGNEEVTATLLDLIDRGVVNIERIIEQKKALLGLVSKDEETYRLTLDRGRAVNLDPAEAKLLTLFFEKIARKDSFTMAELQERAKAAPSTYVNGVNDWKKTVGEDLEARGFVEQGGTGRQAGFIVAGAASIGAGFLPLMLAGSGWGLLPAVPAGVTTIVLGSLMKRRSPEAAELHAKYEGVRNYLKDFGRMQEKPPTHVVLWKHFLVLAVVFGIADEVIKAMHTKVPEVLDDPYMGRMLWLSTPDAHGVTPMSALTTGVASAASVASSANSSSSGGGGGFSGGGGGGGGGGGCGAG